MTQRQPSLTRQHVDNALAPVAFCREETRADREITVTSPYMHAGAAIPARNTDYGEGISPVLHWTRVDHAISYVLLVEDPDAPKLKPFVHWLAWNIPVGVHALPEGIPQKIVMLGAEGMCQGLNSRGRTGYFGPRPPQGDKPHHYHFQVFALDCTLALPDDADRGVVLAAMSGHVLAKGQLVATGEAPMAR